MSKSECEMYNLVQSQVMPLLYKSEVSILHLGIMELFENKNVKCNGDQEKEFITCVRMGLKIPSFRLTILCTGDNS